VPVLYDKDVELPSDMSGVLYTVLDEVDGWRMELAREMAAADLPVDLNRVLIQAGGILVSRGRRRSCARVGDVACRSSQPGQSERRGTAVPRHY
jgi:hypothetical protein